MRAHKDLASVLRLAVMASMTKNPHKTFKANSKKEIQEKFKNRPKMNSKLWSLTK
jgi:hypothetical protein